MKFNKNSIKTIGANTLLVLFIAVVIVQSVIIYQARIKGNSNYTVGFKGDMSKCAKIRQQQFNGLYLYLETRFIDIEEELRKK